MSHSSNDHRQRISAFLAEHGLNQFHFVRRAKHPAVIITTNDREIVHAFPGTSSDYRSIDNCISDLRHRLGLVGLKVKKANDNRPRRKPARKNKRPMRISPTATAIVAEDRFHAPLAALKARMLAVASDGTASAPHSSLQLMLHET